MVDKSKPIILSLGGSLVIPNGGPDVDFLNAFNTFVRAKVIEGWRFFIVVGGGSTARHYIDGAKTIGGKISDWDLDWLGIHTTRLNAHLIKTIFEGVVHPRVIQNYQKKIANLKEPIVVAAGWKPGWSTDYDAVTLARDYDAEVLINLSNVAQVYDKDPRMNEDAKPLSKISWDDFSAMVGDTWTPGKNVPFDPIASKVAKKLGLKVVIMDGGNLPNLDNFMKGNKFVGTVIG